MASRARLVEIEDLKIAKQLLHMEEAELNIYVRELDRFIEAFPTAEAGIRESLEAKDGDELSRKVLALREELIKIGADEIAAECWKNVNSFSVEKFSRFEAYVNFLLSQLSALSIDVQMALFEEDAEEEEEVEEEAPQIEIAPVVEQREKVVLAVDDDPQCLDVFKLALKDVPCKIIAVTSGALALNIVKKQRPDLFVFDIDMPVMNGLDLAKKIKEAGFNEPLIFITGNSQKEIVVGALKAGGNDFILKPINPQNVVERVTKFLGLYPSL